MDERPAFYAAASGGLRDWWTLLHPPYTAWNLSYVAIGNALAPRMSVARLVAILAAFFLGLGVAAHALDELNGRPLRTRISDGALRIGAAAGLAGAVALGIAGISGVGFKLVPVIVVAVLAVLAYNLEWFGGRFHTDFGFAAAWGAFPVVAGYFVQAERIDLVVMAGALAGYGFAYVQRILSTRARFLRREVTSVSAQFRLRDGTTSVLSRAELLAPYEASLKLMALSMVALAATLVAARLT
jgi:hypothetical protein